MDFNIFLIFFICFIGKGIVVGVLFSVLIFFVKYRVCFCLLLILDLKKGFNICLYILEIVVVLWLYIIIVEYFFVKFLFNFLISFFILCDIFIFFFIFNKYFFFYVLNIIILNFLCI